MRENVLQENATSGTKIISKSKLPSDLSLARWATFVALNDFHYFLSWVLTKDEVGGFDKEPYPVHLEYTKVIANRLQGAKRPLWIPKSRRLMLTWTMCAYILWKAMQSGAFHSFIQ